MVNFYLKKIINGLIALFIFVTIMFFVAQAVIPHDFTVQFAMIMNADEREALQEELGLDQPLWVQYGRWMRRMVTGDLGTSFYGYPVWESMKTVIPRTLLIFLTGTIIAFVLGQWLGKLTAWRGPGFFSGATTFSTIALYTSFPPWLAFLVVYFLVRKLELFPPVMTANPIREMMTDFSDILDISTDEVVLRMLYTLIGSLILTIILVSLIKRFIHRSVPAWGFLLILGALWVGSWYVLGFGPVGIRIMHIMGAAIFTYVLLSFGETMLIMQTTMRDTLSEEYIKTAHAKGIKGSQIRDKHASRNAIIPVFSRLVVSLPYLLTGIVIIERAVEWPGMGNWLFNALYQQDMPVVLASLLVIGLFSMVARIVLEIVELYIDPRIRDRAIKMNDVRA